MLQLYAELEASKVEKSQKDALKRFLVSIGFANLSHSADLRLTGAAALSGIGIGQRRAEAQAHAHGPEIEWPDVFDINV